MEKITKKPNIENTTPAVDLIQEEENKQDLYIDDSKQQILEENYAETADVLSEVTNDTDNDEYVAENYADYDSQSIIEETDDEDEQSAAEEAEEAEVAEPVPAKRRRKYRFSASKLIVNLVVAVIAFLAIFGCVKGIRALSAYIASNRPVETKTEMISITSTGTLAYERFGRGVIVANSGNLAFYNGNLHTVWELPGYEGMPVIRTKGDYALVAYTDTTNAVLINKDANTIPVTVTGKIVSSYVNENGYFALVMTEDGYKNLIEVFDNTGAPVYKWHSAENYVTSVAISPDNRSMAAATVGFSENGFDSGMIMFDLAQSNPNAGQHQSNNLIMTVEYVTKNRLVAVGDKSTTYYRKDGKVVREVDYENKKLITYDFSDTGRLLLCFAKDDSAMSNCDIYSYKSNGKKSGHFETEGKILSVSGCDDKLLVAKDSEFDLINENCRRIRTTSVVRDLKNSVLFNGGREAFVISGNVAQVVKVK